MTAAAAATLLRTNVPAWKAWKAIAPRELILQARAIRRAQIAAAREADTSTLTEAQWA